jgi:hypothetical protein
MITKVNQSYVNKIKNNVLHSEVKEKNDLILSIEERARYDAAVRILKVTDLPITKFGEQDLYYIQLLKFFLVPKEKIHKLYEHVSKKRINRYYVKKNVDIGLFDSSLIGIDKYDYLDLVIDYI